MIFASKGYKQISCKSLGWEEWVKLIDDDQQYCKKLKYRKPIKKVPLYELPSWHPYWQLQIRNKKVQRLKELRKKYNLCKANPDLIKVYFDLATNLADIKKKIKNANI